MKILLDECVNAKFRSLLIEHETTTVNFLQWCGIDDRTLINRAAENGFDCFITVDRAIETAINLTTLPIAIIILHAPSNRLSHLRLFVPDLLDKLAQLRPKTLLVMTMPI